MDRVHEEYHCNVPEAEGDYYTVQQLHENHHNLQVSDHAWSMCTVVYPEDPHDVWGPDYDRAF